jgi:putative ABC transport system permease protein
LESILIILGVALGVTVICSVVGLIAGYNQEMNQQMSGPQMRTFSLMSSQYSYEGTERKPLTRMGRSDEKPITLTYDDYVKLRDAKIEGLFAVWLSSWGSDFKPNRAEQPDPQKSSPEEMQKWESENMIGYRLVTPEVFQAVQVKLVKGDLIRADDVKQKRRIAVIGEQMAEQYFGSADPIGKEIHLTAGPYTVVGVVHADVDKDHPIYYQGIGMDGELNQIMYIPYFSMDQGRGETVSEINCMADDGVEPKIVHNRLKEFVQKQYGDRVAINGMYNFADEGKRTMRSIEQVIGIFACAALLIAAINILNLMMARVLRRTKHIGIAAAVGASRRDIFTLFMTEALLLGFTGSVLGIGMAYGATKLLESLIHLPMKITMVTWMIGIGSALFISLISGLYPASQAAKLRPAIGLKAD